jgi:4-hydroxy-tetrahydrodipicolinate reductase
MGSTTCQAVDADPELDLVAAIDPGLAGQPVPVGGNARACAEHGLHLVVGTTGIGPEGRAALAALYPPEGPLGCILAANFAIGAVLSMRFAELAAPWFETAEIIELHHDRKVDAPSGTAMATAARMAAASGEWAPDPTETAAGARGGQGPGGIRIHSVRLRGLVAHQEVLLGTTGETLTIRHDSMDRASFMPGVVLAVKAVAGRPGLTIGIDSLLGL